MTELEQGPEGSLLGQILVLWLLDYERRSRRSRGRAGASYQPVEKYFCVLTTIYGVMLAEQLARSGHSTSPFASTPCPPLTAQHLLSLPFLLPLLRFPGAAWGGLWTPCPASPSPQMLVKAQTCARHSVEFLLIFPYVTLETEAFIWRKILQKGLFTSKAQILLQSEDIEAVGS